MKIQPIKIVWICIVLFGILGGLILLGISFLPYPTIKNLLDHLTSDGNLESFTQNTFYIYRLLAIPIGLLCLISGISFLLVPKKTILWLERFLSESKFFFDQRYRELKQILLAIAPAFDERSAYLALMGITLLSVFFRAVLLWRPMVHDEAYTYIGFVSQGLKFIVTDYHVPNNHVFHSILVYFFTQIFGIDPWVIRFPAFIAGVLLVPATFLVAKMFYNKNIGLISSSLIAFLPVLVDYSTVARGYSLIALFTLIITGLAAYIKDRKNILAWVIFIFFAGLGLYTVPIMLYPIGMVLTWLLLSALVKDINPEYGIKFYGYLLLSGALAVVFAVLLYLPILMNSGVGALLGNDVVQALNWVDFRESIIPRIRNTWEEWSRGLPLFVSIIGVVGLGASLFVPKRHYNRRVPLILASILWISVALVIQRVTPWPRVWLFLLPLVIIWIAAGLVGLISLVKSRISFGAQFLRGIILTGIIIPLIFGSIHGFENYRYKTRSYGELEKAVLFLKNDLQENDLVVAISPDLVSLQYYFKLHDIPAALTDARRTENFQRLFVLIDRPMNQSIDEVLQKWSLFEKVDLNSTKNIYETDRYLIAELSPN